METIYVGKLGSVTMSANTSIIIRFADAQVLEFANLDEARGFLAFYDRSPTAKKENPAKIYCFRDNAWVEESS